MPDGTWQQTQIELEDRLHDLLKALRAELDSPAADLLQTVTGPSAASFETASAWLSEIATVIGAVLRRFPPPPELARKLDDTKELAWRALHGDYGGGITNRCSEPEPRIRTL